MSFEMLPDRAECTNPDYLSIFCFSFFYPAILGSCDFYGSDWFFFAGNCIESFSSAQKFSFQFLRLLV
jgi:hypothetical protein